MSDNNKLEHVVSADEGIKLFSIFPNIWNYRELLVTFTLREIKALTKQTILGVSWVIIQPVFFTILFTIVFHHFAKVSSGNVPYHLFSFSGLVFWLFFTNALNSGTQSLVSHRALITKIAFPREIIVLAGNIGALINFSISFALLLIICFFSSVHISLSVLLIIPLFLIFFVFTFGLTLILSSFNVYYRDIRQALPFVLQCWMFITPIIYPLSIIPGKYQKLYLMLNPVAIFLEAVRGAIFANCRVPEIDILCWFAFISLIVFFFGIYVFKSLERYFSDVI